MSVYLNTGFDIYNPDFISAIDELPLWSAPFGLRLLKEIKYRKNITVIDIGFGLGFPLLEVAQRLGTTCKVYGIDPWVQAVERTERKIHHYGVNNVELITGEAENIPLPNSSIDLIISNNGINNVKDPDKTLSEISRIAKPGAQFVFTFNTDKTMLEFYTVFETVLLEKNLIDKIKKLKDHIYAKRKPVEEVVTSLMQHNFSINLVDHDEFQYVFTDGTTMLNHFLIQLSFIESWKKIIQEDLQQTVFMEIEERLNARAEEVGSLKLTVPFALVDAVRT
jgi:arsenite methyltransferase